MASIKEEIAAIAADHGYTGSKPKTIAGAIDALADTLAGTDVEGRRTIAGAVKALAPYIGSGGGGSLGAGYIVHGIGQGKIASVYATRPDDLTTVVPNIRFVSNDPISPTYLPAGTYVAISATQNGKAYNNETMDEIDFEIREMVQGGTTNYLLCFVMPEFSVSVDLS